MRLIPLIVLCAGCTSVVPTTASRLGGLSPLTMDPGAIAVALNLPAGVGVDPAGAQLYLGAERSDTGAVTGTQVTLARRDDPELGQIYAITPEDATLLRAEQQRITGWRNDAPGEVTGTLSVTLAPCRIGAGPDPDATASVAVRFAPDAPFSPLLRDAPIARITDGLPLSDWPDCAPAG